MNINELRKKNNLSQDEFANLFHVSRQTVSSWENGKSYPDVEMLIKISQHFGISVDDLVKNETHLTTSNKSKTKSRLWLIALPIFVLICVIAVGIWNKHNSQSVNFSMKDDKTYRSNDMAQTSLTVAKGYFTVPKAGKLEVKVNATTDNGNLHLTIVDNNNHHYYQIDGDDLKDSQKLYFKSGDYCIRITADAYTEKVVSLDYNIKVNS